MSIRVPREFINEVLNRTEIIDLIDARVPLRKKSNNNYFACCPFHTEKSASFSVSQVKQFYYCFGCGAHGNAIDFLIQFDRLSFMEAVEQLAKLAGLELPQTTSGAATPPSSHHLYDLMEKINQYYQTELRQSSDAIAYLKQRGISGKTAKQFNLGFAPAGWGHLVNHFGTSALLKQQLLDIGMIIKKEEGGLYDRFRERAMFPIHDRRGRVIAFGGRTLGAENPKYLNSPETLIFQKGHELYGLYHALQANRSLKRAIIVEGYMDVIALFSHGITEVVATLGTATTRHHIHHLTRYTTHLIFCFDGDAAGRGAAWRALLVLLPLMQDDLQIKFMFLPEGEDPDSLVRKAGARSFEEKIQNALTFSQFFFQTMAAQSDLSTMDGRARFVKMTKDLLNQLPQGIFQQMMLAELAKKAQIDVAIATDVSKNRPAKKTSRAHIRAPSTVRLAISLLVQNPTLAHEITGDLPLLDMPGYTLFKEIVELAQQELIQTTGELLEHWRDHPDAKLIVKLAQMEHMVPALGIKNEFLGALNKLNKIAKEQLIKRLIGKAAAGELQTDEKKLLTELIHSKEKI